MHLPFILKLYLAKTLICLQKLVLSGPPVDLSLTCLLLIKDSAKLSSEPHFESHS